MIEPNEQPGPADRAAIGASQVWNNDWTQLDGVPEIAEYEPTVSVSVVIPYYNRRRELILTLAGLVEQSYPLTLLEVVIADDGSEEPPEVPSFASQALSIEVIRQERMGFGAPRARNAGVRQSSGEILVFLDSDMIPEREHIEAHLRWHHATSDAVTIGRRVHADFEEITASEVQSATRDDELGRLMADRHVIEPAWIANHLNRTASLTKGPDDYWRIMSGGNLAVGRALYDEVGGSDESFNQWGGEDNELGYRLVQAGALVVPEPRARCWHQGEGHQPDAHEAASLRMQRTKMRDLMADRAFRGRRQGRSYTNPYVVVTVLGNGFAAERVGHCVDAVLASETHDLVVVVVMSADTPDGEWIRREYIGDPRVIVDVEDSGEKRFKWSPLRVRLPASALLLPGALERVVEVISDGSVGTLHLTVPGALDERSLVHAVRSRALNRVRRLRDDGIDPGSALSAYFGERWDVGGRYGIAYNAKDADMAVNVSRSRADLDRVEGLVDELHTLEVTLAERESRRAMQIANALGTLLRARSGQSVKTAWSVVLNAIRNPHRYQARDRDAVERDFLDAFGLR